jgi:thioredoxin 1
MAIHLPTDPRLAARLADPHALLVVCLCAAWCGSCREYQEKFSALALGHSQHVFVWLDIEEHAHLLDDEDVENFPTVLVQDSHTVRFFGPLLPHIGHLERLLAALLEPSGTPAPAGQGPDLRAALTHAA